MSGAGQRIEVPLTRDVDGRRVAFPGPARLQGLELSFRMPPGWSGSGPLTSWGSRRATPESGDADWRDIGWAPNADGFHWTSARFGAPRAFQPPPGSPGRSSSASSHRPIEPIFGGGALFRNSTTLTDPQYLPAVVGRRFLDLSGASVGEEVAASISGLRVTLAIIGVTDQFPSLDPAEPFAIVDATTLSGRAGPRPAVSPTKEWWLSVDPAAAVAVEDELRSAPIAATEVIGRAALTRSRRATRSRWGSSARSPWGRGRARLRFDRLRRQRDGHVKRAGLEFAILRALGLSARELSAWVSLENAFLLVFGLSPARSSASSCRGRAPFATLTETGEAAVPAPDIVVPWAAMAPLYAAAGVLFVVTAAIVTRQVRRAGISTVLRSGEGRWRRSASRCAASATAGPPSSG